MLKTYFWSLDMENEIVIHNENQPKLDIESKILVIRGQQVMLDRDLAELYGVETRLLNQAVKRNLERFPERFMFQLTKEEMLLLDESRSRSQIVILNDKKSRGSNVKYLPYAFTEQGVAMLASVLKSDTAVLTSIMIIDAFVALRRFVQANSQIFQRLDFMEKRQISSEIHLLEHGKKIDELSRLRSGKCFPKDC